jgi:hypothetical protein
LLTVTAQLPWFASVAAASLPDDFSLPGKWVRPVQRSSGNWVLQSDEGIHRPIIAGVDNFFLEPVNYKLVPFFGHNDCMRSTSLSTRS